MAVAQGFRHEGVEAGRVDVAGHGDRASLVGGIDDPVERFGGVLAGGQHADVVDHDQVARQIRATVRAVEPSALARLIVPVSVSRVNQATRRSASIASWARASTK